MANEISGLSALDPRVAATEKFIQEKNIPPDQVANFLMTMGADPRLAGLVLKYQRLKQGGQDKGSAPPESTVAQDIDNQLQRQQGVASLPAPVMDRAQFAGGGVVALADGGPPTEARIQEILRKHPYRRTAEENALLERAGRKLTRAQFSEDSAVMRANRFLESPFIREVISPYGELSEEELAKRTDTGAVNERIYRALGGDQIVPQPQKAARQAPASSAVATSPLAATPFSGSFQDNLALAQAGVRQDAPQVPPALQQPPTGPSMGGFRRAELPAVKTREQYYKELRELQEKEGIGAAAAKRAEALTKEESRLQKEYGSDKMLAFAEAGFRMAGAASRPGATFLGALGEGAITGTQALRALNKEKRAAQRTMEEARFQLEQAEEQRKAGNIKEATVLAEKSQDDYNRAKRDTLALKNDIQKLRITTEIQRESARSAASERAQSRDLSEKGLKLEGLRAQIAIAEKRLAQASRALTPDAALRVAAAEREIAHYNRQIAELGGTTAYSEPSSVIDFSTLK